MTREAVAGVRGIVLAGSHPRGQSLFDRLRPRPLLPVAHSPLVAYALRWLGMGGVSTATVCSNSAARAVRAVLSSAAGLPLHLEFYEDWMPRGAAGCVRDAGLRTDATTFVVVDGTTIPTVSLRGVLETHESNGAAVTVVALHDAAPGSEKCGLTPAGIYVFDRRALDFVPPTSYQDIKESLIPRLYEAGERVVTHAASGACARVVDPESYLALNHWMIARSTVPSEQPLGWVLEDETLRHSSARVEPGARLVGPVILGPGAFVGEEATVLGPAAIGAGSRIEAGATVSRSVLWNGCRVGEESTLDRCVLADGSHVRARSTAFNVLRAAEDRPEREVADGATSEWGDALLPLPAFSWPTEAAGGDAGVVHAATWPSRPHRPQDKRAPGYTVMPTSLRGRMLGFVHKGNIMKVWTGWSTGRRPVSTDSSHSG
jgi:mannose-1-phosphate guanylyltransferase